MQPSHIVKVTTPQGAVGTIDTATWPLDGSQEQAMLKLPDGKEIIVPVSQLARQTGGDYRLEEATDEGQRRVVPVVEERLDVGKRRIETGRVRVSKVVREREETIDPPLLQTDVAVEHVPINRPVDAVPPIRQEGDTTVVSVVEEELVIQKRLVLKEEIRITRRTREHHALQRVSVRREEVHVERVDPNTEPRK